MQDWSRGRESRRVGAWHCPCAHGEENGGGGGKAAQASGRHVMAWGEGGASRIRSECWGQGEDEPGAGWEARADRDGANDSLSLGSRAVSCNRERVRAEPLVRCSLTSLPLPSHSDPSTGLGNCSDGHADPLGPGARASTTQLARDDLVPCSRQPQRASHAQGLQGFEAWQAEVRAASASPGEMSDRVEYNPELFAARGAGSGAAARPGSRPGGTSQELLRGGRGLMLRPQTAPARRVLVEEGRTAVAPGEVGEVGEVGGAREPKKTTIRLTATGCFRNTKRPSSAWPRARPSSAGVRGSIALTRPWSAQQRCPSDKVSPAPLASFGSTCIHRCR